LIAGAVCVGVAEEEFLVVLVTSFEELVSEYEILELKVEYEDSI
jgi:hypothetical protein